MLCLRVVISIVAAFVISTSVAVGQCTSLTLARLVSSDAKVMESKDNLVFLAQPRLLEIYDLTDPAAPNRVASVPFRYEPSAIEIQNNVLYIASYDWSGEIGALMVVDITTVTAPVVLADITWNDEIDKLAASNNRLCVLTYWGNSIRVLDVTNPAQPISGNTLAAQPYDSVEVRQNILYTTFRDYSTTPSRLKLRTVNIADIVNTNVINTIDLGEGDGDAYVDRLETTLAVAAAGRLSLFDLSSTPGNPVLLSTSSGARVDSFPRLVSTGSATLCHMFTGDAPAGVWDVTNPATPSFLSGYGTLPRHVAPAGAGAMCFDNDYFISYSFATPSNPVIRWLNDYGLTSRSSRVSSVGDLLLFPEMFHPVADRVTLVDGTDIDAVEFVSSIVLPAGASLQDAQADGDLLSIFTRGSTGTTWDLAFYDVSDPAQPLLMSEGLEVENTAFFANAVLMLDRNIAAVEFYNRCILIDVSDPAHPRIASYVPQTSQGHSHLDDGLLVTFFDLGNMRFEIRDVTDPDRPVLASTVNEATVFDFALQDRILAFERSDTEVAVYDLSVPSNPVLRSVIVPPAGLGAVSQVALAKSLCVVSCEEGQAVYSLATPASPVLIGQFAVDFDAREVLRSEHALWVVGSLSDLGAVTLPELPIVTRDPLSRAACAGSNVILTADATSDTALSYRWRYNGSNVSNGTLPGGTTVSGAFTRTLTLSNFNPADAGVFNLRFTNSCGSVLSENAIISAGSNPFFLTVPSQQFGCVRGTISFTVSTNFPSSTSIRWQAEVPYNSGNFVNLSDFTTSSYSVSGAFTPTLTFTPLPGGRLAANLHTRYRAVASTTCGSTTSTAARLDLCTADFNCDQLVDLFDYLDFVDAFANVAAGSDFNADGVTDFFDYLDFVAAFATGC